MLEAKRTVARDTILAACSRRKLKPLRKALAAAAQRGLTSEDDAVAKGEALKVSRDSSLVRTCRRSSLEYQ